MQSIRVGDLFISYTDSRGQKCRVWKDEAEEVITSLKSGAIIKTSNVYGYTKPLISGGPEPIQHRIASDVFKYLRHMGLVVAKPVTYTTKAGLTITVWAWKERLSE